VQSDETSTGLLVIVLLRKATVHCLQADESSESLYIYIYIYTYIYIYIYIYIYMYIYIA
jgi:hypothetical protein